MTLVNINYNTNSSFSLIATLSLCHVVYLSNMNSYLMVMFKKTSPCVLEIFTLFFIKARCIQEVFRGHLNAF